MKHFLKGLLSFTGRVLVAVIFAAMVIIGTLWTVVNVVAWWANGGAFNAFGV